MAESRESLEKVIRIKENEYKMLNETLNTMVDKSSDESVISEVNEARMSTMNEILGLKERLMRMKKPSKSLYDEVGKGQYEDVTDDKSQISVVIRHWKSDGESEKRLVAEKRYPCCTVSHLANKDGIGQFVIDVE